MGAERHANLAAVDVIVELVEQLLALVDGLVVIHATEQGQVVAQRIADAQARIVLVPGILQAAGVEAQADIRVEFVISTEVADPGRVDPPGIEGGELFAHAGFVRLAHGMQAPALQGQAVEAAVLQGHALEAFRQQSGVAVIDHRRRREHIADTNHRIEETCLQSTAELAVLVPRLTAIVHREYIHAAPRPIPAIAGIELQSEHGEEIHPKADAALGESRLEASHDPLRPGLGVAVSGAVRLAMAEVAVHIEVSIENLETRALDESFRFLFSSCQ
ncbi:hypothetical protein D3C78_1039420 [compost metagenome]